jgi:putative transposase
MGMTIRFKSHRVELAAVYEFEHDTDILEYYDQPPSFKLEYPSSSGRRMGLSIRRIIL